jgi:RNA polymerase sigma factor (sigma-70 family)
LHFRPGEGFTGDDMLHALLQRERSLDEFIDKEESFRLGAAIADPRSVNPEDTLYLREVCSLVRDALVSLDERERVIIRNRYGLLGGKELTLEEIGKTLNLSRERVRQLEREAKDKLKATLEQHHPHFRFSLA